MGKREAAAEELAALKLQGNGLVGVQDLSGVHDGRRKAERRLLSRVNPVYTGRLRSLVTGLGWCGER